MSDTINVRVKHGKTGFIYGRLRGENKHGMDTFTLKPVTHSTEVDDDGELKVITAEEQFSKNWMERVGKNEPAKKAEPKQPSEMSAPELKAELTKAGVDIPDKTKKTGLLTLLEDHLADQQE